MKTCRGCGHGKRAVLVAIAIPIFTSQLEKSREATDAANVRDYYAEISVALLNGDLTNAVTGKDTTIVGNNKTATITGYTATIAAGETFNVTVPYDTVQQQQNWQGATPSVSGVEMAGWTSLGTGKTLTYTFTYGTDGDVYLSGIAVA